MNKSTIIILGATGDLTKRKLLPAIYNLVAEKKLNKFLLVGAAIDDTTIETIINHSMEFIEQPDQRIVEVLKNNSFYNQVDFNAEQDFHALNSFVTEKEKEHGVDGNRLIYLATSAHFFCSITVNISLSGLAQKKRISQGAWHRIVYEKPFGSDLHTAREINACIASAFEESQIFRVDHYLTKELVSNIALVRFTNCVFEPLWNNRYIDHVQIILDEQIGLEGRGAYYDQYGALADVVQNHMLMLLALTAMESPEKLIGDYIRDKRVKILEKIRVVDGILGQYNGYKQEKNVATNSQTETFAALYLTIKNPRWAGVPFYLRTGKCLNKKQTVIHIKFKQVDCLLARNCPSDSNWLTIEVEPHPKFSLFLNAKKPGKTEAVVPVAMEFSHSDIFDVRTPEAYEVLLEEVMSGEQSTAVRFDEIEQLWRIIDSTKMHDFPLFEYERNSNGPDELKAFSKKHGMRWRS